MLEIDTIEADDYKLKTEKLMGIKTIDGKTNLTKTSL